MSFGPRRQLQDAYDGIYTWLPIPVQNLACTAAGYSRFRSRFTKHFFETLEKLEISKGWSFEELLELQRP